MIRVRFWGTRGSIPSPGPTTAIFGGNTTCIEVRINDLLIIFDAGTGIRGLGDALMAGNERHEIRAHLFITHTHWDHIQGFPFFSPAFCKGNRFFVYGSPGSEHRLEDILSSQMRSEYFPVPLGAMVAQLQFVELSGPVTIHEGDTEAIVDYTYVNHPGSANAYKIQAEGKTVIYTGDHEIYSKARKNLLQISNHTIRVNDLERQLIDFVQGADLLITDSQYTEEEYQQKQGWGHSTYDDSIKLARAGRVRHLVFFHHDPTHTDEFLLAKETDCKAALNGYHIQSQFAREGVEIML